MPPIPNLPETAALYNKRGWVIDAAPNFSNYFPAHVHSEVYSNGTV